MKAKLFTIVLFFIAGLGSAQSKLGILTYNVPANWQVVAQAPNVVLEKKQIKKAANPCKITVLPTENTAVVLDKTFLSQISSKKALGEMFDINTIKKTQANGTICYGVKGTVTINLKPMVCYFYSISNGKQTSFVRFVKGEDACTAEFQQFWSELLVDGDDTPAAPGAKRKAAGASPAAPAPVM